RGGGSRAERSPPAAAQVLPRGRSSFPRRAPSGLRMAELCVLCASVVFWIIPPGDEPAPRGGRILRSGSFGAAVSKNHREHRGHRGWVSSVCSAPLWCSASSRRVTNRRRGQGAFSYLRLVKMAFKQRPATLQPRTQYS